MQKHRFIQYLISIVIFSVCFAYSQPDNWYQLYMDNNIPALKEQLDSGQISDPLWAKFVQTLFQVELEDVLPNYVAIFEQTNDIKLKKVVLDRISQLYYARGFYETANRILDDKQFQNEFFSAQKEKIYFGIQLGAFSSYTNALRAKKDLSKTIGNVLIVTKNSRGRKLYVVVAGKFTDRQQAQKYRTQLASKYGKKGIIIQY